MKNEIFEIFLKKYRENGRSWRRRRSRNSFYKIHRIHNTANNSSNLETSLRNLFIFRLIVLGYSLSMQSVLQTDSQTKSSSASTPISQGSVALSHSTEYITKEKFIHFVIGFISPNLHGKVM
jgi:hypothetical protein